MQNGLVPHPHVADKNCEEISASEVPSEELGVLAPHQNFQPRVLVPGRELPITSGCEQQRRYWLIEMEVPGVPGFHF